MLQQLALTAEPGTAGIAELTSVAAAIQKQVLRDFAPIWGVQATVDAFATLELVPIGYWPIVVVPQVEQGAGVHLDRNGQPFALVEMGASWSLTASHEILEMLADPFGNRLVPGYSPMSGQGRVEFLVEVCDPSEDGAYAYTSNGVLVSDFYAPSYFDPTVSNGVRYSFTGAVQHPRQVLPGGYLSWRDPMSNHWFQLVHFDAEPEFRDLGPIDSSASLRSAIDERTPERKRLSRLGPESAAMLFSMGARAVNAASETARATELRAQIDRVVRYAKLPTKGRTATKRRRHDEERGRSQSSERRPKRAK